MDYEPVMSKCTRQNLCVDCDYTKCWHQGKIISDCPKYKCDNIILEDCEHCAFIKQFQKDMREEYKKGSVV